MEANPISSPACFVLPAYRGVAIPAAARAMLLAVTVAVYSGAMPYLILVSPRLLYGVYLLVTGCVAAILFLDYPAVRGLRRVAPYLGWVLFYCYWGALVAPPEMPLEDVVKTGGKNALVIVALALAVTGGRSLRRLAGWAQGAAAANMALALWETSRPDLVLKLALAHDPLATAFNVNRPAGIWNNPDEAAFAYLFALFLSRWAPRPLAWIGRAACLAGLFLAASRTGFYVLGLCVLLYGAGRLRELRWRPGAVAAMLFALLALGVAGGAAVALAPGSLSTLSQTPQVRRLLDFAESDVRSEGDLGRTDIAQAAAQAALDGPWYGRGFFTFQLEDNPFAVLDVGAHNFYLTAWGEAGIPGGVSLLVLLALGMSRLGHRALASRDRLALVLLWAGYLVIALTWHNQVTSFAGMLYSGALWHLPGVLAGEGNERNRS